MDPDDVFAILIPADAYGCAQKSFELAANRHLYTKVAPPPKPSDPNLDSVVPESNDGSDDESVTDSQSPLLLPPQQDRITLLLSQDLKSPLDGFQFGYSPATDVRLFHDGGRCVPSARHFNIKVDDERRIWLHDHHSTRGTVVKYEDTAPPKKHEFRHNDNWILSFAPGDSITFRHVFIHASKIWFRILFPNHNSTDPSERYLENLDAFRLRQRNAVPDLNHFGFQTGSAIPTTVNSSQVSRHRRPVYVPRDKLGSGGFGTVRKVINAQNGNIFAIKRFETPNAVQMSLLPSNPEKRLINPGYKAFVDRCEHEYKVIQRYRHPNIIPLLDFFTDSEGPALLMPFYPHGDLSTFCRNTGGLGKEQCFVVLLGLLKAMDFLQRHRVVHRDIKDANIMVELNPFRIVLADFGVATDKTCRSFAGTMPFMAPEVCDDDQFRIYDYKADIWSAAVTILVCYFPEYSHPKDQPRDRYITPAVSAWSLKWAKTLVAILMEGHIARSEQPGQDELCEILYYMLEEDAAIRCSAREALDLGCERGQFVRTSDGDYEINRFTAARVADGQHTSSQESILAPYVEAARSRLSRTQYSPISQIQAMPSSPTSPNATIVPERNTLVVSSPTVLPPTDLPVQSVEQDGRHDYIIGSSYDNGHFQNALPSNYRTSSRASPNFVRADIWRSHRNRSITPRPLDRAGHAQLSRARGISKTRAAASKVDQRYPNTRSAAAAKKFIITQTSYGEPNRHYSAYRSNGHESREQEKLTSDGSVERKVLQLKDMSEKGN